MPAARRAASANREKGALSDIHPQHLGATVLKALAERNKINTSEVDDIVWGTSAQRGTQGGDLGRMAALDAGYDVKSSAMTLDRFCGSGITAVNIAAANIMSGMEDMTIAGGTEMMSRYGTDARSDSPFLDSGNTRLRSVHPQPRKVFAPMPLPRWKALTAKLLTLWPMSANNAQPRQLKTAISINLSYRFSAKTANWRSIKKSSRARKRHWKALPNWSRALPNWPIFRSMKTAQPSANWYCKPIRIWISITYTMPVTHPA